MKYSVSGTMELPDVSFQVWEKLAKKYTAYSVTHRREKSYYIFHWIVSNI